MHLACPAAQPALRPACVTADPTPHGCGEPGLASIEHRLRQLLRAGREIFACWVGRRMQWLARGAGAALYPRTEPALPSHAPCSTNRYRAVTGCACTNRIPERRSAHERWRRLHEAYGSFASRLEWSQASQDLRSTSFHRATNQAHPRDTDCVAKDRHSRCRPNATAARQPSAECPAVAHPTYGLNGTAQRLGEMKSVVPTSEVLGI